MGLLDNTDLDKAYEAGREDFLSKKGRLSAIRVVDLSFGRPEFWAPGGMNRFSRRSRAYLRGYEEARSLKAALLSSSSISSTSVGGSVSNLHLTHQIEMLYQLRSYLITLMHRMDQASRDYQGCVDRLNEDGLLREVHTYLDGQACQVSRLEIQQLLQRMQERDLALVNKAIADTTQYLASVGGKDA